MKALIFLIIVLILTQNCFAQLLESNSIREKERPGNQSQDLKIQPDSLIYQPNARVFDNALKELSESTNKSINVDSLNTIMAHFNLDNQSLINSILKIQENIKKVNQSGDLNIQQKLDSLKKLNDSLNTKIEQQSKIIDSLNEKNSKLLLLNQLKAYNSSLTSLVNSDSAAHAEIQKVWVKLLQAIETFDKYYLRLDTTKYINNRSEYIDSTVDLKVRTIVLNGTRDDLQRKISQNHELLFEIGKELSKANPDTAQIAENLSALTLKYKSINSDLSAINEEFSIIRTKWNHYVDKYIKDKDTKKEDKVEVSALPFVNAFSEFKDVNANLNVIGNNIPKDTSGLYVELGLYTKILGSQDSVSPYRLMMYDVGNYGIYFKGSVSFAPIVDTKNDRFAFNFNVSYLNKPINSDSLKNIAKDFNSSVFHGRIGLEIAIFKNIFSTYINGNALAFVTNNELVKRKYTNLKDAVGFYDWGIRMLLNPKDPKSTGNFKLYLDVNFFSE